MIERGGEGRVQKKNIQKNDEKQTKKRTRKKYLEKRKKWEKAEKCVKSKSTEKNF